MRNDALGFFWEDRPVVKEAKPPPPKKTPPPRTWESPDYLPGLAEATQFNVPILTYEDLIRLPATEEMVFDVETYPNYWLCSFLSVSTGKVMCFELSPWARFDPVLLKWVIETFCLVGFNSIKYDLIMCALACAGLSNEALKAANDLMINDTGFEMAGWMVLRQFKVKALKPNHIDIIEVAPLRANLKIYGGRNHAPRMQDLPFSPSTVLSYPQGLITKYYNVNDLRTTYLLRSWLKPQIDLRYELSNEYGIDLRSKSDAQIAEAVIVDEFTRITGMRPSPPEIEVGTVYKYKVPHFVKFSSPLMNWVLQQVIDADFVVGEHGSIIMPHSLTDLPITMNGGTYTFGIGGLHSTESKTAHVSDHTARLLDRDVTSYYPYLILIQELYPQHLGPAFLQVYRRLVERRVAAKANAKSAKERGDKVQERYWKNIAESLKIVINGSYGKLGSKYSVLYAPDLLVQTTITGQLCLLMMIERMELCGIGVVSANTDGVTMKVPVQYQETYEYIIDCWEKETGFETEEQEYLALYSRDVNNYIAVKARDKEGKITTKTKGAFANPWSRADEIEPRLHKNPTNQICVEAIERLLTIGVSIQDTIRTCTDIRQFVSVRTVKGGAVKSGEYLGKSIRWYYSTEEADKDIIYASSGKTVPRSLGARPCMQLPDAVPADLDYDWYVNETEKMLRSIAYL